MPSRGPWPCSTAESAALGGAGRTGDLALRLGHLKVRRPKAYLRAPSSNTRSPSRAASATRGSGSCASVRSLDS